MSKAGIVKALLFAAAFLTVRSQESYSEKEPSFRWGADEMEFLFEPSFTNGFVVHVLSLQRSPELFVYKLHRKTADGGSFHSLQPVEQITKIKLPIAEFDALSAAFESVEIKSESERDRIGPDGSTWTFRKQLGGRRVTLRFWSPEPSSRGAELGVAFLRAAHLDPKTFLEERPNKAPEPTPTAVTPPANQGTRK